VNLSLEDGSTIAKHSLEATYNHTHTHAHTLDSFIHSFIHSCYLYRASSSPLLLRGAPDTAYIYCVGVSQFHSVAPQATASEGIAQG